MSQVSEEYKLVLDTLSRNYIERQRLQLFGITSMLCLMSLCRSRFILQVESFNIHRKWLCSRSVAITISHWRWLPLFARIWYDPVKHWHSAQSSSNGLHVVLRMRDAAAQVKCRLTSRSNSNFESIRASKYQFPILYYLQPNIKMCHVMVKGIKRLDRLSNRQEREVASLFV